MGRSWRKENKCEFPCAMPHQFLFELHVDMIHMFSVAMCRRSSHCLTSMMALLRLSGSAMLGTGWFCWLLMGTAIALHRYEVFLSSLPSCWHLTTEYRQDCLLQCINVFLQLPASKLSFSHPAISCWHLAKPGSQDPLRVPQRRGGPHVHEGRWGAVEAAPPKGR